MWKFALHHLLFLFIWTLSSPQLCTCLAYCCVLSCVWLMLPCLLSLDTVMLLRWDLTATAVTRVSDFVCLFQGLLTLAPFISTCMVVWNWFLSQVNSTNFLNFLKTSQNLVELFYSACELWCLQMQFGQHEFMNLCSRVNCPFSFPTFSEVLF